MSSLSSYLEDSAHVVPILSVSFTGKRTNSGCSSTNKLQLPFCSLLSVFQKLDIKVLHMACEERELVGEDVEFVPRVPSSFVVEKLIYAGAKPDETDQFGKV